MVVQRDLGARFTDGFEVLYLHADSPATILEVTSVGGEEALRQLGAWIAGPDRPTGRPSTPLPLPGWAPSASGWGGLMAPAEPD